MDLGQPIAEGNTAYIYHYDNKIVKVFKDFLPNTEADYEANKQRYAHSCGLLVPEIYEVTSIGGKQALIMEFVQGKTLGEILFENMNLSEYYMNISIDLQREIHQVVPDHFEPMVEKLAHQIKLVHQLEEREKSILLQKLNAMTYESRLCHGDFHLYNLIQANDHVTTIDWVDASSGDIRADVYRSYLLYEQFSEELADLYLNLYCNKSGLSKDEILKWAPIIAGARLAENMSPEENERLLGIVKQSIL